MPTKKELNELVLEDMQRSGLNLADLRKMKVQVVTEQEAQLILNSPFATHGYVLPYFGINGSQSTSIRIRFLEELRNESNKIVKYSQPKNTPPQLYFPPNIKWSLLLKNNKEPLVFTEGEKKAFKACKEGIPTISLPGVWSFKSKKQERFLLEEFDHIKLKDRDVYICFDNDVHTNADVLKAMRTFAKELNNKGANVYNKVLPFNPYRKIGLDDYLLEHSPDHFWSLPEKEFSELTELQNMNDRVVYIKSLAKFFITDSNILVGAATLKDSVMSNVLMMGDEGKKVPVINQWLQWENRMEHQRLTYKPGQPRVTTENELNMWKGWGCEPEKGNVKLFLNAVNQIFNNDKELVTWFMDWVAYPIQNPGAKMLSAVLLQSISQGTGKSTIGLCIGAMYGENYKLIDDEQLHQTFNEWAVNKQFVLGDEISGKDKRHEADKLKNLVTRPQVTINRKYQPTYSIPDCINYIFTSNHPDPLSIEPDDRRFFVHNIKPDNFITQEQGEALEHFHKGTGNKHLLHYFAYDYVISENFNHKARPLMTSDKSELIEHSLTDMERYVAHLKENPEFALMINGAKLDRDLFTTQQVIQLYKRQANDNNARVSTTAMGKALKKIYGDVNATKSIKTLSDGTQRLRALRNIDKWKKATHQQWQTHYDKSKIALLDVTSKKVKYSKSHDHKDKP